jgi:hypothetical protein
VKVLLSPHYQVFILKKEGWLETFNCINRPISQINQPYLIFNVDDYLLIWGQSQFSYSLFFDSQASLPFCLGESRTFIDFFHLVLDLYSTKFFIKPLGLGCQVYDLEKTFQYFFQDPITSPSYGCNISIPQLEERVQFWRFCEGFHIQFIFIFTWKTCV